MLIGCIKEIKNNENRVGLTPDGVKELIAQGHQVIMQECAGIGAGFHDFEYTNSGAELEKDPGLIADKCDILVKVKEPLPEEYYIVEKMENKSIYTYFHLSGVDPKLTKQLLKYNVTAIAYETVQDSEGRLPLLKPMSEIAGVAAVQYAAEFLQKKNGGRGRTLGYIENVKVAKVMVVGGGVVGEVAARTAAGMGSEVKVFDVNPNRVKQLKKSLNEYLGAHLSENVEVLVPTEENFEGYIGQADVLIGAVLVPGTRAPKVVSEEQIRKMKKGAVVIDVSIDQGGCIWGSHATTHSEPYYEIEGKVFSAVANIPGQFARQSTQALTNATLSYLIQMANKGVINACMEDKGLMKGVNTYKGFITYESIAKDLGMEDEYKDIQELL